MNTFDFNAKLLNGEPVALSRYRGKVLLIVNTASACGFTPQYKGLEALYQRLHQRGLEILAFPCNQFAQQEAGDAAQIGAFCEKNYGVTFPLFEKIDVNGAATSPLFQHLKQQAPGVLGTQRIKWNFTKFLVAPDGRVVKRYAPTTRPEQILGDIEALLATA